MSGCSSSNRRSPDSGVPGGGAPDLAPTIYDDFPAAPVIDPNGNTPSGAPSLFGSPDGGAQSGGPCLTDPELGSLLPQNWLRPRFHFLAPSGQNLFEIRLHAANEANDLVVYTASTTWTMDAATWSGLQAHVVDQPITVTIRGAVFDGTSLTSGPALGSRGTIAIAPASANGAIVYWTSSNGTALRGFTIGQETVQDVLRPTQAGTACIGCHASTPDGLFVAVAASSDSGNGDPAIIAMRSADGKLTLPTFVSTAAQTNLARSYQELPVFSKSHWMTGDRVVLSMLYTNPEYEIIWTDLEAATAAQGTGVLARTGDPGHPAAAAFSHDGQSVVYASGATVSSGVTISDGDLRVIPYANRAGGLSTAVVGASDSNYNEFYPTWSPDDQWLAFDRLPTGQSSYNNAASEVWVIPAAGGAATRLAANDPPACSGKASPGVTNSWPKWAPDSSHADTRTFYWLAFSSTRGDGGNPQVYVAPIVIDGGVVKTYPALYLWNQPAAENNHTPAWDNFQIPLN
jgi:WD40-like Beta Propeller Repeat